VINRIGSSRQPGMTEGTFCCFTRGSGQPGRFADKAYSSRAILERLRRRGIRAGIPVPADQRDHRLRRGSRGGRAQDFDREARRQRSSVEPCINRLKQWRGIATRPR